MTSENPVMNSETLEEITDNFVADNSTHKEVIETVISSLAQNNSAMVSQTESGNLWKFEYGSVEVFVQLSGETDEDLFTVWASVLKFPVKNELELMRKLLEMNWSQTYESRFGIMNEQVVVLSQRTVADLSAEEISRAITLVATIADDNDEMLKETFGGN
ncbi:YbjN domain-containing protein [Aphanothece hegewaldii CCALA 016]|uniref:YbjN domain-containing protein n=1 Tax=Aphanothece hegewaldii CCALA 016 TaxID=2107694 RepID=A0A2T1M2U9_9CHRO|nr:YbjN domain-containing protein [Aphanothece hegewaldii]PSF39076.1 YbjN domain-containing protein [Aphanothece hegewaldii CCALA 016]